MTRNESLLQFQERLINVAVNSPRMESMKLLGIVYANLKEFIEVRVIFEKDLESILDKFFDVLGKFNSAVRYKFPNLYASQYAEADACAYLSEKVGELSNEEKLSIFTKYVGTMCIDELPIGFIGENNSFVHREVFIRYFSSFVNELMDDSSLPGNLFSIVLHATDENRYMMEGDEYNIAPQPSENETDLKRINNVLQWSSIRDNAKHDDPDIRLSFTLVNRNQAKTFTQAEEHRGFRVEMDSENPSYYHVYVINACLIGFDEIAKMILSNVSELSENDRIVCHYQEDKLMQKFQFERSTTDSDLARDRDVFLYRGPRESGYLIRNLLTRFGMTELLENGFDDPNTEWPMARIEGAARLYRRYADQLKDRDICKKEISGFGESSKSTISPFQLWLSYMTIYRTGKLPEDDELLGGSNIADPNLRFILFCGFALRSYAIFYIELRARGDERNNARLAKLLMRHECTVTTASPNFVGKKVHAKVWSFLPIYGDERIDVISTGNFCDSAQTQFYDTVMIQHMKSAKAKINTEFFWDELRSPGDIKANSFYALDKRDYVWVPNSIAIRINYLINDAMVMAKTGYIRYKPVIAIKCNHLTDRETCDNLIKAAKAGVKVILIVRSTCTLPNYINIPNLKIRSIAGRYLEHDRIFAFGYYDEYQNLIETDAFISTADLMPRNLTERIEFMMRAPKMHLLEFLVDMAETESHPNAGFFNFAL